MGYKRLFKKLLYAPMGGNIVTGHIIDALQKKKESGRSFKSCLEESVKETFTEDLPGISHIYQMGRNDGKKEGTAEQAKRDKKKMLKMHHEHEQDRKKWKKIDKEKDELIDELANEQEK